MKLPPLHPSVVHFPIAFVVLSVITEFIGAMANSPNARAVAWWSLVAALIGVSVTVLFGYLDMWRAKLAPATHKLVHVHLRVGWIIAGALLLLTIWRWRFYAAGSSQPVGAAYLICAALLLGLVLFQGWFGGEIAFSYGGGSAAAGQGMLPLPEAQAPAGAVADALRKLPLMGESEEHGHSHDHDGQESSDHHH